MLRYLYFSIDNTNIRLSALKKEENTTVKYATESLSNESLRIFTTDDKRVPRRLGTKLFPHCQFNFVKSLCVPLSSI